MTPSLRWYDSVIFIVLLYLFVVQIQAIWPFTVDDMYISLRYAKNWTSGHGLLWNLNQPPVEGYSNFSFVVLAALAMLLHIDPVFVLKISGLIGLICTCGFLYLTSRFWLPPRSSLLPGILLLLYKGQIIWAVSGLETTVYESLITGAVFFIFRGLGYHFSPQLRGSPAKTPMGVAGLLLALAALTRPEAPALIALFFILICWDKPNRSLSIYWQSVACFIVPIVLIFFPYFLWRWHYYGYLFPNPVYCKGLGGTSFSLDLDYLTLIWPFVLLTIPAWLKAYDKRYYFLVLPSVGYLLMLINADPIVAFANRLFLPAFVLLLPLAFQGLAVALLGYFNSGIHSARIKQADEFFWWYLLGLSCAIAIVFIPKMTSFEYRYFTQSPLAGEQLRFAVVDWLNQFAGKANAVVLGDSGMIPYLSHLEFIDSYCLNNLSMAHTPVSDRYAQFCQQTLRQQPKIIILTSLTKKQQVTYMPSDICLKKNLKDDLNYKMAVNFSITTPDSTYQYELYTHL